MRNGIKCGFSKNAQNQLFFKSMRGEDKIKYIVAVAVAIIVSWVRSFLAMHW